MIDLSKLDYRILNSYDLKEQLKSIGIVIKGMFWDNTGETIGIRCFKKDIPVIEEFLNNCLPNSMNYVLFPIEIDYLKNKIRKLKRLIKNDNK